MARTNNAATGASPIVRGRSFDVAAPDGFNAEAKPSFILGSSDVSLSKGRCLDNSSVGVGGGTSPRRVLVALVSVVVFLLSVENVVITARRYQVVDESKGMLAVTNAMIISSLGTNTDVNLTSLSLEAVLLPYPWAVSTFENLTTDRPLNFVHIPKTGGSSIVQSGIDHNMSWGDCLFQYSWPGRICPSRPANNWKGFERTLNEKDKKVLKGVVGWHLPIQYIPKGYGNPYKGYDLFAVVRNPYERAVSEFYYKCKFRRCRGIDDPKIGPKLLNQHIQQALKVVLFAPKNTAEYYYGWSHWVPQYDYFYDSNGRRLIQHILHNEHLNEQFDSLMLAYFYHNISLPRRHSKSRKSAGARWGVQHLLPQTLKLIEVVFERDFVLGGYRMISDHINEYVHDGDDGMDKDIIQSENFLNITSRQSEAGKIALV